MKRINLTIIFLGLAASGCVSINTYEARMKACRESMARASEMESQLYDVREKNRQLESSMGLAEREQEEMRETIQSQEEYINNLRGTYDELINELKDDIARGDVSVKTMADGLSIVMEEKILFKSGEYDLQPQGKAVLSRIGGILKDNKDSFIRVDGHTDNVKISPRLRQQIPTNWELSALRAAKVLRHLEERAGVNPNSLFLAGFSMYRPVADNKSEQGRELNRRVEITLIQKK
jgi:chemotaxis protein MotB